MAKNSKNQQDDQKRDDEFVDLPEDRLEQIGQDEPQGEEAERKTESKPANARELKQDKDEEEASKKVVEKPEVSPDDLLADVRQALVEEEVVVEEPKGFFGRMWQKLRGSSKSETEEPAPPQPQLLETEKDAQEDTSDSSDDLQGVLDDLTVESEPEPKPKPKPKKKSTVRDKRDKEEEKSIQEFFADLEALADVVPEEGVQPGIGEQESTTEESQEDEKLKIPKLPAKSEAEDEIDFEAVRDLALEDYDETVIEPEERKKPLREEVRQTVRELKPVERFLLFGVGIVTVGVLLFSGIFLIVNSVSVPTPTPTAEVDLSETVYPTRLTLPGGWTFPLGQGRVVDGEWTPNGAEWLVGTEISRWVTLPWSLQLEAVLRTLTADDQIELTMSNFDVLTFDVYSIREISMEELLATDPTKPALLVVLYNDEEADGSFWTVTALPARDK